MAARKKALKHKTSEKLPVFLSTPVYQKRNIKCFTLRPFLLLNAKSTTVQPKEYIYKYTVFMSTYQVRKHFALFLHFHIFLRKIIVYNKHDLFMLYT